MRSFKLRHRQPGITTSFLLRLLLATYQVTFVVRDVTGIRRELLRQEMMADGSLHSVELDADIYEVCPLSALVVAVVNHLALQKKLSLLAEVVPV
jgi:hypothetical protein